MKVFISSVSRGIEEYRSATRRAIDGLDGFESVAMEDFNARPQAPAEVCSRLVAQCQVFVCILGHRYGTLVPGEERSFSELEYDVAVEAGLQILAFAAPEEAPVPQHLIEPETLRKRQQQFRDRVLARHTCSIFRSADHLGTAVSASLHNLQRSVWAALEEERDSLAAAGVVSRASTAPTDILLIPFVSNQAGMDTGIAISNHSGTPLYAGKVTGHFTLLYFGNVTGGGPYPQRQTTITPLYPGQTATFTLESGGTNGIAAVPGFQGFIVVECAFPAHGLCALGPSGPGAQPQSLISAIRLSPGEAVGSARTN